ncbi:MAG: hypothetical protein GTN62_09130 [Gemmatimonadales bacterium]|nr:hypothetical protein [Gemmatimonadales bacterium]NIN11653.1 hypothetical protein [Gemmatimonadales bacterium]NIN50259.1 hypothetical protein [Gemmatimonadales bacterium]NIP07723.1 hypothetical protein [Gemmatimonadales bacterium]NIQ99126.1 hypothetical protein [Gemmatimonadales bacterium]
MRWPLLAATVALCGAALGCDKLPFLSQEEADTTAVDTTAVAQAPAQPDTTPVESPEPVQVDTTTPQQPVEPPPQQPARRPVALVDEPWTPVDTGTVRPGMTRMDVVAVWGAPVAERSFGSRAYLYFRNGCEVTCGTFDVVFLEGGQVVDAIVRGPGHTYAGVSSSPPGRQAEFTPPRSGPSGIGAP